MSTNLFAAFRRLIPSAPLQVGTVVSASADSAVVELPGGARISVRGTAGAGTAVFVRAGAIEGTAPNLPVVEITV